MHYGLFTWGTRGDNQPFVALSHGLMGQGDQVTFFAPENFKSFIEGYGVIYSPLTGISNRDMKIPDDLKFDNWNYH